METSSIDQDRQWDGNLILLWRSAIRFREEGQIRPCSSASGRELRINELSLQLRADSVDKTRIHFERGGLRDKPILPPDFDAKIPLSKTKTPSYPGAPTALLERFLELGADINIISSVIFPLRCVSRGINPYVSFCALLRKPILPPRKDQSSAGAPPLRRVRPSVTTCGILRRDAF